MMISTRTNPRILSFTTRLASGVSPYIMIKTERLLIKHVIALWICFTVILIALLFSIISYNVQLIHQVQSDIPISKTPVIISIVSAWLPYRFVK